MGFDAGKAKQWGKDLVSGDPKKTFKSFIDVDPGNALSTGRTQARKAQEKQSLLIERQRQREELKIAESEDLLARKRSMALSGKAGRKSLIQTSETGASNLGGTI